MKLSDRQRLRLRFRDLSALAAYLPVGLSTAVPAWVSAVFAAGFGLSLAGQRPLARGRVWSALVLVAVALGLFGLAFRGALDLVVAAVSFATLVLAHRLVSAPTDETNQQALLAALLLMAGGAALSGEMWYGLCLLAFGTFACLHLGLRVVEGPHERDEELPMGPVFRQVSLGVTLALVGGVAFFVLFPRLSWNVASRRSNPSLLGATTGMADRVRLSGGGDIKTSARTVLKAQLEPDPGVEQLDRYWLGRRFDVFDGREWRGSGVAQPPEAVLRLGDPSGTTVTQRVELLPAYGAQTMVALEEPYAFANGARSTSAGSLSMPFIEALGEEVRAAAEGVSYRYTAMSASGPRLDVDEATLARALALPPLDPRIPALARQLAGDETDPARIARRLEESLRSSYGYTLELGDDVPDPLAAFLFERREGHCEHFATALAVLLRSLGIPARVAAGFFGGQRLGTRYAVRAGDAHAWVEAWVGDAGWVRLDATPEEGRVARPTALWAMLSDAYERMEELWRQQVIDYGFMDQLNFVRRLVRPPRRASQPLPLEGQTEGLRAPGTALGLAGAALAVVLVLVVARLGRNRRPTHPATSFLERLEARLDNLQVARPPGETMEELSRRLRAEQHPLAAAVAQASQRYLEARFGGRPMTRDEERRLLAGLQRPQQG